MKTSLDQFKEAWQKKSRENNKSSKLKQEDIMEFLEKQSHGISALYRKGLMMDFVQKGFLAASFVVLLFLYSQNHTVQGISAGLAVLTAVMIFIQYRFYREVEQNEDPDMELYSSIKSRISFFNRRFIKAVYVGAISNPLIFVSGMMFYFYYRHGGIRPLDMTDALVLGSFIIFSFVAGLFINLKQYRFHIGQLETSLKELDEETFSRLTVERIKNQRRGYILMVVLAVIIGLLIFLYLAA